MIHTRTIRAIPAVKELLAQARSLGWTVKFKGHRPTRALFAYGYVTQMTDTGHIVVFASDADGGPSSLSTILFVLAHEIRHMQHIRDGLYAEYYETPPTKEKKSVRLVQARRGQLLLVGLAAERDCDQFARNWLKSNKLPVTTGLMRRRYPVWKVSFDCVPTNVRLEGEARRNVLTMRYRPREHTLPLMTIRDWQKVATSHRRAQKA